MKKHIVCFGDSNTHGYCADPADCTDSTFSRFNESERWTCLLQKALGGDYLVLEEGLSGRTSVFSDPLEEGLSGIDCILPCLKTHKPVSLLIIMLGTNDTKERFGANAACIALGLERLVRKAQDVDCWSGQKPNILLIAPPPIDDKMEISSVGDEMGRGCAEKSRVLPQFLKATAELTGAAFLDAKDCEFNRTDFMHLTQKGHAQLSEALSKLVLELTNR